VRHIAFLSMTRHSAQLALPLAGSGRVVVTSFSIVRIRH